MNLLLFLTRVFIAVLTTKGRLLWDFVVLRRSRIFDPVYYLTSVSASDRWWVRSFASLHYLVVGENKGLSPNPLFLIEYYRGQFQTEPKRSSLLIHYIQTGGPIGLRPNPFFVDHYYIQKYHDILQSGQHPLAHYYWHGYQEQRDPHPNFNQREYSEKVKLPAGVNPLVHYLASECALPTELWGLAPGVPVQSTAAPDFSAEASDLTVDLIVPVYRRPDCVEDLFDSLFASPDWQRVANCFVVDDCGDRFTSTYLSTLVKRDQKLKLIKNESNLGFLRSVNKAYAKTTSSIVVLVNSDIKVPMFWLNRLVTPMAKHPKIALVTPLATSGANLSVALRPGQSWVHADQVVSRQKPNYPDACTGIGYLMAIRREAIVTKTLFDEVYQHGYGEDTDLHYQLVSTGWRSVVCDNMVVLHKGGASYLLDDQKSKIYEQNRKIFFERWGSLHKVEHERFVSQKPLEAVLTSFGHTNNEVVGEDLDILFVAPTNNKSIGGVKIIFELAAFLSERGKKVKILCTEQTGPLSDHVHDLIMPVFKETTLLRQVKSVKFVVGTGIGVADYARHLKKTFHSKLWWLVQGPECYFGIGEHYQRFVEEVQNADHVVTVSQYLTNLVKDFGVQTPTTLPLGPDQLMFYPRDVERQPGSIAIQLIDTPDKGSRFAISFAEEANRHGMKAHFFGGSRLAQAIPKEIGTFHGKLDSDELSKLFSRCEWYLDLSFMEGLGLLPLEAAMCGCKLAMTRKGAPELIFNDSDGVVWLESHLDYKRAIQMLLKSPGRPAPYNQSNNLRAAFKGILEFVATQ